MWSQDRYLEALQFAEAAHRQQRIPGGDVPYVVHVCQVAMEVMACPEAEDLAVLCALLHDTIEDAGTSHGQIEAVFGRQVADGVQALTKNEALPKPDQMADSLARIRQQPHQVWMVKLADRITNLQAPPRYWKDAKKIAYRAEAEEIVAQLGQASAALAARLADKIAGYGRYIGGENKGPH